nr:hypothetical protein [Providencia stuartii]
MKTKQTKMKLTRYELEDNYKLKRFKVAHHNGHTTVEQDLTVRTDEFGRVELELDLNDFPRIDNELEAMLKYADWLERMGIAIRREAKRAINRGVEWWKEQTIKLWCGLMWMSLEIARENILDNAKIITANLTATIAVKKY